MGKHPDPQLQDQLLEPPCTEQYARWCGRGGAARLPPIPINPFKSVHLWIGYLWNTLQNSICRLSQYPPEHPTLRMNSSDLPTGGFGWGMIPRPASSE